VDVNLFVSLTEFVHYRLINGWHMTSLLLWRLKSIVFGEENGMDRHRNGVNFILFALHNHIFDSLDRIF